MLTPADVPPIVDLATIGKGMSIVTVKLELKPEIEAVLAAQAHALGLSLESYLDQVLQSAAAERVGDVLSTQAEGIRRAKEVASRPRGKKSLAQLFADSPFKGLNLTFERDPDTGRSIEL